MKKYHQYPLKQKWTVLIDLLKWVKQFLCLQCARMVETNVVYKPIAVQTVWHGQYSLDADCDYYNYDSYQIAYNM